MHPYGFSSLSGFTMGCGLLLIINMAPSLNTIPCVISFGIVGAVLSRFGWPNFKNNTIESGQVRIRGFLLGWAFSVGILLTNEEMFQNFGVYCCLMSLFHVLEFVFTALTNPPNLDPDSFLINHSKQYGIAVGATVLEYFAEAYFFCSLKNNSYLLQVGMAICISGEIVRKGAMLTLWSDFTHLIRRKKVVEHRLRTNGLYSFCRHPSYAGAYWWFMGLQVILINPICLAVFPLGMARFLQKRIYYEEARLLEFFTEYSEYQKMVPRTGVPFTTGCQDYKTE